MYDIVTTLAPSILIGSSSFFVGNKDNHNNLDGFKIEQDWTRELAILECLKYMHNVVTTLAPFSSIGSSSFLQVTMTLIQALISFNF